MTRAKQQTFFVEFTDTHGGQPNYSWVTRHKVKASSPIGVIRKVNRVMGVQFKREYNYGEYVRYNSKSGATCAFVEHWDEAVHGGLTRMNTELS